MRHKGDKPLGYSYDKRDDQNELQYIWRLCHSKDDGLIDMTWVELADVMNRNLREDGQYWSESAYRKKYQEAKAFYDEVFSKQTSDDESSSLINERHELEKETVRVRDERNELRRLLREQARNESFIDQLVRMIKEHTTPEMDTGDIPVIKDEGINAMLVPITDIHTGMNSDNYWNYFDDDVLEARLSDYLTKVVEIGKRHNVSYVHVVISELISGYIHPTLRIESNKDVIEQFLTIMDYLTQFLIKLNKEFPHIYVYCVPGNHSRMTPNKKESVEHENIDILAIPMLSARLQNYHGIEFATKDNEIDSSIIKFWVNDRLVLAVHGDKDNPDNMVEKLTMMVGIQPDIILCGHRHTNGVKTVYDTKIIQSGSLSGTDQYCVDHRLKNRPEQFVAVVGSDGVDCLYDVKFD